MMARFFASYVSPSERPRLELQTIAVSPTETRVVAQINAALSGEPVLPEGWAWRPETWCDWSGADTDEASCDSPDRKHIWWDGEECRLYFHNCGRDEFPEVERYVLWKNGVAQP